MAEPIPFQKSRAELGETRVLNAVRGEILCADDHAVLSSACAPPDNAPARVLLISRSVKYIPVTAASKYLAGRSGFERTHRLSIRS